MDSRDKSNDYKPKNPILPGGFVASIPYDVYVENNSRFTSYDIERSERPPDYQNLAKTQSQISPVENLSRPPTSSTYDSVTTYIPVLAAAIPKVLISAPSTPIATHYSQPFLNPAFAPIALHQHGSTTNTYPQQDSLFPYVPVTCEESSEAIIRAVTPSNSLNVNYQANYQSNYQGNYQANISRSTSPQIIDPSESQIIRGLDNRIGDHNCFLNVVVQSLWHLEPFRTRFINLENHNHIKGLALASQESSCIVCALSHLFSAYKFSDEPSIAPIFLREALANSDTNRRFQIGDLDDAAEAHEALLNFLHKSIAGNESSNISKSMPSYNQIDQSKEGGKAVGAEEAEICEPPCIAHQVFSLSILEQFECNCREESEPLTYNQWIHYVPSEGLREETLKNPTKRFDKRLRLVQKREKKPCGNQKCAKPVSVSRVLLNLPHVITIGIAWNSNCLEKKMLEEVLNGFEEEISPQNLFSYSPDVKYHLQGMICYYGAHYVTQQKVRGEWVQLDDSSIKFIGKTWEELKRHLVNGRLQPNALWFVKEET